MGGSGGSWAILRLERLRSQLEERVLEAAAFLANFSPPLVGGLFAEESDMVWVWPTDLRCCRKAFECSEMS